MTVNPIAGQPMWDWVCDECVTRRRHLVEPVQSLSWFDRWEGAIGFGFMVLLAVLLACLRALTE